MKYEYVNSRIRVAQSFTPSTFALTNISQWTSPRGVFVRENQKCVIVIFHFVVGFRSFFSAFVYRNPRRHHPKSGSDE